MDKQAVWDAVQAWPVEERIDFISRVWDQIEREDGKTRIPDELKAELDRRWANFLANPESAMTWEQALAHIERPK